MQYINQEKSLPPKAWDTSVIFRKLPEEKSRPLGEKSPNLATLPLTPHRQSF
jgi:hypothetical protein